MAEVEGLAGKWQLLATYLRLKGGTRDTIQANHPRDIKMCLFDAISEWLEWNYDFVNHGKPSWRVLAKAVKSLDGEIFNHIARKHIKDQR